MTDIPWRWHILTTYGNVSNWSADKGVNILSVSPLHSTSANISRQLSHDSCISLPPTTWNGSFPNSPLFLCAIPTLPCRDDFLKDILCRQHYRCSIFLSLPYADFNWMVKFLVTTLFSAKSELPRLLVNC